MVITETPHKPGMLRSLTTRLAEKGIDLCYLYATASDRQEQCQIVFATTDNNRAVVLLSE